MDGFKDVKVLSFNHFLAGPVAAQLLGDLGADVVAVEPVTGTFQRNWAVAGHFVDGQSVNHLTTGRNKRNLAVDMKCDAGKNIIRRLIAASDVVMENFRPGAMSRLGFDPDALLAEHPKLIYATATGFGTDGPFAQRPGQDLLLQAMSGLAAHTGRADGPPVPVGSVVIDHHAAALYAMGILAALFNRERTGKGGRVDVNLLQAAIDLQGESIGAWLNGAPRAASRGMDGVATWFSPGGYGIHAAIDGHVAISMSTPSVLSEALGVPALGEIPDDAGFRRSGEVTRHVADAVAAMTLAEVTRRLDEAGVWNAIVQDYDALLENPQLEYLDAFPVKKGETGAPVTLVAHPVRYDGAAPEVTRMPQSLGAQSREILAEAGFSAGEIDDLLAAGVVVCEETSEAPK